MWLLAHVWPLTDHLVWEIKKKRPAHGPTKHWRDLVSVGFIHATA